MILVVGLGNPGRKYRFSRHNIGFSAVDKFGKENHFPNFKLLKKFKSLISKAYFDTKEVILAKPQTFMNASGKAVKKLFTIYYLPLTNLWVIHDDIDLPLGKIKISKGRGSAGHKGVQSIINELGTKDFIRFRVGISPKWGKPKKVENFVLRTFTKKEEEIVKKSIQKTALAIETALKEGIEKAMNKIYD